jgi:3-oxoacyl-[acyl-carrier-protein] synthase I
VRRVAVTGMGIVSSLGNSLTEVCEALRQARSGVELIPERKQMGFRSAIAGTLKGFAEAPLPKKHLRNMGQTARLAVVPTLQAISDASLSDEDIRSVRTAIVVGNEGNMEAIHEQCDHFRSQSVPLGGSAMQRAMASSVSANLAVLLGARGPALTVATACASGATAIGLGYWLIKNGMQDRVICGGVQEFSWQSVCHLDALRVFSIREDAPQRASRPFDRDRDGFVPSCGAGIVILEDFGRAVERKARIRAELRGFATTTESVDMTVPSADGCAACMAAALQDAGLRPGDVDYVNAHATSTRIGDVVEAQAIAKVFGNKPWVSSTKSSTGHELGAAGSNEFIYTVLMMNHGFIAPTINIDEIDEECRPIRIVCNKAVEESPRISVSNSFAFGGVNTSLVICRV